MNELTPEMIKKYFQNVSQGTLEANCFIPLQPKKKVTETVGESKKQPFSVRFTIPLSPIGAPRMTQCDKWKKRPVVERYRAWRDAARPYIPENLPTNPCGMNWTAYVAFPKSYSAKKRAALKGELHQEKPDRDNIDKCLQDFLFEQDKGIAFGRICKLWDDGNGPRVEIEVFGKE